MSFSQSSMGRTIDSETRLSFLVLLCYLLHEIMVGDSGFVFFLSASLGIMELAVLCDVPIVFSLVPEFQKSENYHHTRTVQSPPHSWSLP